MLIDWDLSRSYKVKTAQAAWASAFEKAEQNNRLGFVVTVRKFLIIRKRIISSLVKILLRKQVFDKDFTNRTTKTSPTERFSKIYFDK